MERQQKNTSPQSVVGYIHNLSDLKQGTKRPYFEAEIQQKHKIQKLVVFKPDLYTQFKTVNDDRTPVCLHDVVLQPSRLTEGTHEVLYTYKSTIASLNHLDYSYNPTLSMTEKDLSIAEILKVKTSYRRVNVKAKILQNNGQHHNFIHDGTFLLNTTSTIADTTASINFTVWNDTDITIGSWYLISNASIRLFNGETTISTTKDTELTPVSCQDETHPLQHTTLETLSADIVGANIDILYLCPQKHKIPNMSLSSTKVQCEKCNTYFKSACITHYTHGTITIKTATNIRTLHIENNLIRSVVDIPDNANTDNIIDALLALPPVHVTVHKNNLTRITTILNPPTLTDMPKITFSPTSPAQASSSH
nr:uncharacterized protein LOC129435227 [Misgurnus anguillicaudatus]